MEHQDGLIERQTEGGISETESVSPEPYRTLRSQALILLKQGRFEDALWAMDEGVRFNPPVGMRIEKVLMMPPVLQSSSQVTELRNSLEVQLQGIAASGAKVFDPAKEVEYTNFYLAYQGKNDKPIQQLIARTFLHLSKPLSYRAPHIKTASRLRHEGRIGIGVCSNNLRDNTVGLFFQGLIGQLDKRLYDVTILRPAEGKADNVTRQYEQAADRCVLLSAALAEAQQQIAQLELDILFYPDLTVNPFITFLAFARLAVVQITSWGHPVTSGIPNIDYYISGTDMEPPNAEDHYSEKLIKLSHFPTSYKPSRLLQSPLKRGFFGLPDDITIYFCGHQASKFHPEFDAVLAEILERDADGTIAIVNAWLPKNLIDIVYNRFKASFPHLARRLKIFPRQPRIHYLSLLNLVDVHLDPIYFGGGRTTFDILANGKVIVTWPGPYQRGRVTFACYKKMVTIQRIFAHNRYERRKSGNSP
ncbi:MAG: repeat-containing protein [Candidatus Brocadiaceae bacterium]|nr:repeat-containing protein [Candidatus Brocadiaceae bacterium]